jgi:hypothetical protein
MQMILLSRPSLVCSVGRPARFMGRFFVGLVAGAILVFSSIAPSAWADPKADKTAKVIKVGKTVKHHWDITTVAAKSTLDPALAKLVAGIVTTQLANAIATNPGLAPTLPADADPSNPTAFRKQLQRAGIAESHRVSVDITEATEQVDPIEGKPGELRLTVHVAIHLLGEKRADKVISFAGEGRSTIKQDIGKKLRPADRIFAWTSVVDAAIADAISTSLTKLSTSATAPAKKSKK